MNQNKRRFRAAAATAVALCTIFAGTTMAEAKGKGGGSRKKSSRRPAAAKVAGKTPTTVASVVTTAPGTTEPSTGSPTTESAVGVLSVAQHAAHYRDSLRGGHRGRTAKPRSFKLEVNETVAATAIGITKYQLKYELDAGITVEQVAANHSVAASVVSAAVTNDMNAQIAYALVVGQITQAQADALSLTVPTRVTAFMTKVHRARYTTTTTSTTTTVPVTTTTEAPATTTTEPATTTTEPTPVTTAASAVSAW